MAICVADDIACSRNVETDFSSWPQHEGFKVVKPQIGRQRGN